MERLKDSFFRALFHSPVVGVAVVDLVSVLVVDANDAMLQILGRTRDDVVGVPDAWREITLEEYAEGNAEAVRQAAERGYSDPLVKEYVRPDGSRIRVRTTFGRVPDYPDRLVVFASDISEEWRQREESEKRDQRLRIAISAADQGVWDFDLVTREMIYSDRAKEIYGLPVDQPVTFEQIRDATHPEDYPNTSALLRRATDPELRDRSSYEYRIIRPDGTICWALAHGEATFEGPPGAERAVRYTGTIQDITERKLAEARQRMLVAELNHRVKNTLAIVQSFAHQSLRPERPPEEARRAFEGRLEALAAAHDLLTEQGWQEIPMGDLVRSSLAAHDDEGRRFALDGPQLRVTPKTAVTIAMTLHELVTNATKYGALSADSGRVALAWKHDGNEFTLRWQERSGPPCSAPARPGFGTRMLERALSAQLGGTSRIDYASDGLIFELVAEAPEPL